MKLPAFARLGIVLPALVAVALGAAWAIDTELVLFAAPLAIIALGVAQSWARSRYRRSLASDASPARARAIDAVTVGAILLAAYCFFLFVAWSDLSDWPRVGSWWTPFVAVTSIGAVYQLILVGSWASRQRLPLRRLPSRAVAVVAGLVLAGLLEETAAAWALGRVRAHHARLLQSLDASANACQEYRSYLGQSEDGRGHAPRSLHTGAGRYVLTFWGGSADVDGSTIVLDSTKPEITLFHNDDAAARQRLTDTLSSLEACPPK